MSESRPRPLAACQYYVVRTRPVYTRLLRRSRREWARKVINETSTCSTCRRDLCDLSPEQGELARDSESVVQHLFTMLCFNHTLMKLDD